MRHSLIDRSTKLNEQENLSWREKVVNL